MTLLSDLDLVTDPRTTEEQKLWATLTVAAQRRMVTLARASWCLAPMPIDSELNGLVTRTTLGVTLSVRGLAIVPWWGR